jgi:pimeloyl-ACP methyl ester carboxylesterase
MQISSLGHRLHQFFRRPYLLHTETYGDFGPTVVLLHGINGSGKNWETVTNQLKDTHQVVVIDLLGFGQSQKPDNMAYSPKDHIKSIRYTLKKLGVQKPFTITGHSMGAILGVYYAARYPRDVNRLILCGMPYYNSTDIAGKFGARWAKLSDSMLLYAYRGLRRNPRTTVSGAKLLKRFDKKLAFELTHTTWYPFHQSLTNTIESQKLTPLFKKIKIPIDLIYGRRDRLLNHGNLRRLAKKYPNVHEYKFPGGHDFTKMLSAHIVERIKSVPDNNQPKK